MGTTIVTTLIDALGSFVTGIGGSFVEGFETLFTTDGGALNNLGITILTFGGITLGYGVIRYIMGFFRKES